MPFIQAVQSLLRQVLDILVFDGVVEGELREGKRVEFIGDRHEVTLFDFVFELFYLLLRFVPFLLEPPGSPGAEHVRRGTLRPAGEVLRKRLAFAGPVNHSNRGGE